MTNTNDKIRALFLTALMVFSVFAGTVALSGSAVAQAGNSSFADNDIVFQGEQIVWDSNTDSTGSGTYQLYEGEPGDSTPERPLAVDDDGNITIDTSSLESGTTYFISNEGGGEGQADVNFTVREQDFSATFDEDEVGNAGETVDLELASDNRIDNYEVEVTADDLDDSDLMDIFNDSAWDATNADVDDDGNDDDDDGIVVNVGGTEDNPTNFDEIDAGNYTFNFEVADTSASDEANINVNEVGEGQASFETSSIEEMRGGVAKINISISGASEEARVTVGNYDKNGYQLNFTAVDGDDDGHVTAYVNTYAAGQDGYDAADVVYVDGDSDDEITGAEEEVDGSLSAALAADNYRIATAATADNYDDVVNSPDDVGTLVLRDSSLDGVTLWTAPGTESSLDTDDDDSDVSFSDLETRIEDGSLTETDDVAIGDYLVVQVSGSGLSGMQDAFQDGDNFFNGTDAEGAQLTIEQAGNVGNFQPKVLNYSGETIDVYSPDDSDEFYFVIDTGDANWNRADGGSSTSVEDGESYEAEYTVTDDFLLDSEDEDDHKSVNSSFEFADPSISIDDDPVNVAVGENQSITGTSTLAPGTEIEVRAESDDEVQPAFFKSDTAVVQADGSWTAELDFDEQSVGDTFSVEATAANEEDTADGEVVDSVDTPTSTDNGTVTTTGTGTPTTDGTPTDTATPDDGTPTDTETTTTTTPGFTAVLALVALIGAALLATRRD